MKIALEIGIISWQEYSLLFGKFARVTENDMFSQLFFHGVCNNNGGISMVQTNFKNISNSRLVIRARAASRRAALSAFSTEIRKHQS